MSDDNGERPELSEIRPTYEGYQLKPSRTPHANAVLKGIDDDMGDLEVELCIDPEYKSIASVTAWDLDDHQRELIAAGAHIRLGVWQHPIPPLSVGVEAPFCEECQTQKIYVKASKGFFCAGACPLRDPRFGPAPVEAKTALDQAHEDFSPGPDED